MADLLATDLRRVLRSDPAPRLHLGCTLSGWWAELHCHGRRTAATGTVPAPDAETAIREVLAQWDAARARTAAADAARSFHQEETARAR